MIPRTFHTSANTVVEQWAEAHANLQSLPDILYDDMAIWNDALVEYALNNSVHLPVRVFQTHHPSSTLIALIQ